MSGASTELFMRALQGAAQLPAPGAAPGTTLARWRALAVLAAQDLAACKLAEAHWDALTILQDIGVSPPPQARIWSVWAAENPRVPLQLQGSGAERELVGSKSWCSGAGITTHALLTCEDARGQPCLVMVDMRAAGITLQSQDWQALGMRHVPTPTVRFERTAARWLGARSVYLQRPGFWHGGAGIAACWYGAACEIAQLLRQRLHADQPHAAAHLGAMFTQLRAARAMFHQLAQRIDAEPHQPWVEEVQALRAFVRGLATEIIERSARAMGPGPLCTHAQHAQRCADLAVWCTQQHAEKDLEALGRLSQAQSVVWEL
jgi:alkylation response protein AidB-like acyl-CoA dehydrogenase